MHQLDEFALLAAWERLIRRPMLEALDCAEDLKIDFDTPVVFMVTVGPNKELFVSIDTRGAKPEPAPHG